jgi:hypothetical protein
VFTLAYYDRPGLRNRIAAEQRFHTVSVTEATRIEVLRGRFEAVRKAADSAELRRAVDGLRDRSRSSASSASSRSMPPLSSRLTDSGP